MWLAPAKRRGGPSQGARPCRPRWAARAIVLALAAGGLSVVGVGACGDDLVCPTGTTGDPCRYSGDVGPTPTPPPLTVGTDVGNEVSPSDGIGPSQPDGSQPDGSQSNDAGPEVESSDASPGARRAGTPFVRAAGTSGGKRDIIRSWPRRPMPVGRELHETPNAHIAAGPGILGPARQHFAPDPRALCGVGTPEPGIMARQRADQVGAELGEA
jgi:hypothetical protein